MSDPVPETTPAVMTQSTSSVSNESQIFGVSIRSVLAFMLVCTICIVELVCITAVCWSYIKGHTEATNLFASQGITTLGGVALGYYFAQKGTAQTTTTTTEK